MAIVKLIKSNIGTIIFVQIFPRLCLQKIIELVNISRMSDSLLSDIVCCVADYVWTLVLILYVVLQIMFRPSCWYYILHCKLFVVPHVDDIICCVVGYVWTLVFSTSQHGFSLNSMYRKMTRVESPILLVIQDTENNVSTTHTIGEINYIKIIFLF